MVVRAGGMTSGSGDGTGGSATGAVEGTRLWSPSFERRAASRLAEYLRWLHDHRGLSFDGYSALWHWSVTELEAFWQSIADFFGVGELDAAAPVLDSRAMPGARWFPGRELCYAEHALRRRDDHPAIVHCRDDGSRQSLSYAQLAEQVARARRGLERRGVGRGDRVAALLPNGPEAVVVLLAAASLGAITSTCSPELGPESVLARFAQIEPKVLVAVAGYRYGERFWDRTAELAIVRRGLPSVTVTVLVGREEATASAPAAPAAAHGAMTTWEQLLADTAPLTFERVPFEHPLWVLYSSGTTGLPKPIVHGHGGIVLEHYKALALHCDLSERDRFFWYSTTGWMMWNFLCGGLLCGATIVLYEGSPAYPDLGVLWRMAAAEKLTYFGTSAPFLRACQQAGLEPGRDADLSHLRSLGSTGAPLAPDGFAWVYQHVGSELLLGSVSGGTDVCTAFLLSCPLEPVHAGELQCAGLGCKVEAWDADGHPLVGTQGELVLTEPLPSMPVGLWNDPDGRRYRESYFSHFDGVWRHGDWVRLTARGSAIVEGRSDATLNRGGVRVGTSELYSVVEQLPFVVDSLVVDTGSLTRDSKLWLFVVMRAGAELGRGERERIRETIRQGLSPRHVPDVITQVAAIPRTVNGKKLEVPVKRILMGTPLEEATHRASVAEPSALDPFVAMAREQAESPER